MISVERVSKRFGRKVVLDGVDLEVADREVVVILGPSGIGKTVLLKIMAGLLAPDRGRVRYDGIGLDYGLLADNRALYSGLGYVFQGGALFDSMTVLDNVALPLVEGIRVRPAEARVRAQAALARVGMGGEEALYPRELSGGMTRLVAIARALVAEPRHVFYDEPTGGLDPVMRDRVCELIAGLRDREGRTELVVTHDLAAAESVADRILMLRQGRLIALEAVRKEDYAAQDS